MRAQRRALTVMADPDFDPARSAVVHGADFVPDAAGVSQVEITHYAPEQVEIAVETDAAGYLLLADAYYPGWQARVNGEATPVYRADVMLRAVPVPSGSSTVVFTYAPIWLSGCAAGGPGRLGAADRSDHWLMVHFGKLNCPRAGTISRLVWVQN
jgi:hypothetical protein